MSSISKRILTKDQLLANLESDGINVSATTLSKAKNGDGDALFLIAHEYYYNSQHNYAKVMAWSQLSAEKNYSCAQTMIGFLYHKGQGVPINYSIAIEYYLKAARQRDKDAWFHIGYLFECGDGVPVDKYKALEWYSKDTINKIHIQKLTCEGYYILDKDKHKTVECLIEETEAILNEQKKIKDVKIKQEENQQIQDIDPVKRLKEEAQRLKEANTILKQRLKDRDHIIGLLKQENQSLLTKQQDQSKQNDSQTSNKTIELLESLVQSKTNEIEFLKEKATYLERENLDLKYKFEDSRQSHLSRQDYSLENKKRKVEY